MYTLDDGTIVDDIPENYTGKAIDTKYKDNYYLLKNGNAHSFGEPSFKIEDEVESWCIEGKLHRIDGPAVAWYDQVKSYAIFGNKIYSETTIIFVV